MDDNRELYVPELNKTIKAHRNFRLFATQNPFANYAGRKRLSRALLNRFVILKFSRLPTDELYSMVHLKCQISESAARLIISVLKDLRARRSYTGMFSMHDGFMTLRDVFKWANRFARSDQIDWRQCLADHGFMVLCARCRTTADENLIKHTIEHYTSRKIIPNQLFAINSRYMPCITEFFEKNVVPTFNMRRMIVLCSQAWIHNEPVLLVGETGCGKTTVAQLLAKFIHIHIKELYIQDSLLSLNCQERTDTCDLLGSIRPGENGTFKWFDGVVVTAMRSGRPVLLDEISLASDSVIYKTFNFVVLINLIVLERLNPLLEPSRSLFLTESGTEVEKIVAEPGFQIISTMNPGGDYGKKELSKALRNRFTEIWCPAVFTAEDVKSIICHRLSRSSLFNDDDGFKFKLSSCMARFLAWYFDHISKIARCGISLRDVVAFVEIFISSMKRDVRSIYWSVYEAFVAIDDGISLNISDHHHSFEKHRFECQEKLKFILMDNLYKEITEEIESPIFNSLIKTDDRGLIIGGYLIEFGAKKPVHLKNFVFNTDWFEKMSLNIARALSIDKPILIQGEPGCGKSSIVVALAAATGHHLTRLNLSEQTELSDLFGTDVPTVLQDGRTSFEWKDGPLLTAINNGHWILLDEMNLASQSILEGLNACFDHRHQLFIPELNRMFEIGSSSHNSKFFACQNPHNLGGNRRALPKSFLNRFSVVSVSFQINDYHDYLSISSQIYGIQSDMNQILNKVNRSVKSKMLKDKTFAKIGGPYEFNIRDVLRWSSFISEFGISNYPYELLYVQRFRTEEDREVMREIYKKESGESCKTLSLSVSVSDKFVRIGRIELIRSFKRIFEDNLKLLPSQASILEHLATCVRMNWISLIVGESKIGKSSVVKNLAALTGNELKIMRLTSETDASELIGSFEQVNYL
ncbi:unnamed protein product [Dracunculus medinensis]|uniref:Midasin n=1 Tax=Dracunculus medinensis TaxID=318479 RepID=A0A3P7PBI1_DRAME|nr:unnamed protein product [Dracunculus medinensis]